MKYDFNLLSTAGLISNDYYGVKLIQLFDADETNNFGDGRRTLSLSSNNNFATNLDALEPAAMVNIDAKSAIAIFYPPMNEHHRNRRKRFSSIS